MLVYQRVLHIIAPPTREHSNIWDGAGSVKSNCQERSWHHEAMKKLRESREDATDPGDVSCGQNWAVFHSKTSPVGKDHHQIWGSHQQRNSSEMIFHLCHYFSRRSWENLRHNLVIVAICKASPHPSWFWWWVQEQKKSYEEEVSDLDKRGLTWLRDVAEGKMATSEEC